MFLYILMKEQFRVYEKPLEMNRHAISIKHGFVVSFY